MIITRLIKYIAAVVGNIVKGIINVDYKVIIEVLMEVYFEVIARRSAMFIRSQITSIRKFFLGLVVAVCGKLPQTVRLRQVDIVDSNLRKTHVLQ